LKQQILEHIAASDSAEYDAKELRHKNE